MNAHMALAAERERQWSEVELVLTTKPEDTLECSCSFCHQNAEKTNVGEFSFDTDPKIFTKNMPGYICRSENCTQLAKDCALEDGDPDNWGSWLPQYLSGEAIHEMATKATKILAQYGDFKTALHFVEVAQNEEEILAQESARLTSPQAS